MTDQLQIIRQQMHSCETLMNIFQKERSLLNSGQKISQENLMQILQLKKRLMETFQRQQSILSNLNGQSPMNEQEATERKTLLSKLGRKIEQLLVIDRENEILLKRVMNVTQSQDPALPRVSHNMPARISVNNRVFGGPSARASRIQQQNVSIRSFNPERLQVAR